MDSGHAKPLYTWMILGLVGLFVVFYAAVFPNLFATLGWGFLSLSILPVVLTGLACGIRWGAAAGLAVAASDTVLMALTGQAALIRALPVVLAAGAFLALLVGVSAGWVHNSLLRLRKDRRERREFERQLRESEELLRSIIDHAPYGITVRSREGDLLLYNPAWMKIWALPEEDVKKLDLRTRSLRFEERYPYLTEHQESVQQVFDAGGELHLSELQVDQPLPGAADWVSQYLYGLKDDAGQVEKVVTITRDISERKRAETILKNSEIKYRSLFNNANDGIFIIYKGRMVDCNKRAEELFGYSREEIIGKTPVDFSPERQLGGQSSEKLAVSKMQAAEKGDPQVFEWIHQRKDGNYLTVEVSLNRIPLDGRIYLQAVTRDITERKRHEAVRHTVYRISEAANMTADIQDLFSSIHAALMLLMPADNFYIALYDSETDLLSFPYFVDQHDPPPEPKKPGKGLTEYVLKTCRPLLITEEVFDKLIERGEVELIGTPSIDWMGVPLRVGERVIGVAGLQSFREHIRYTPEDLDMLRFVSDQIAMAIERKRADEQLKFLSHHDALTGLYNRAFFEAQIEEMSCKYPRQFSVVMADMDRLKFINDNFGHSAGDQALRDAARLLQTAFRPEDIIARIGGDEFAVLLPSTGAEKAEELLKQARRLLDLHNETTSGLPLSISFGVSSGLTGRSMIEIVRRADQAMYCEKKLRALSEERF